MTDSTLPKRCNSKEQPHYFGTYLNMARHNAFMIINYLSTKYTGASSNDDAKTAQSPVLSLLLKSKKPDEVYALIGDLLHYFPFLRYQDVLNEQLKGTVSADAVLDLELLMKGGSVPKKEVKPAELQPKDYADVLRHFLELLNQLRNAFSHYNAPMRFKTTEQTDTLFKVYDAALFRLIDKNKQTKRYDYFEPQHIAPLERTKDAAKANRVPHTISPTAIDEKSLAYFICLFLEPKYASMFLSRLAGFQKALTEGEMTLFEKAPWKAYTMFCCRLPQPKLESSDIMLDMLNELNRCPSDLYPVLSEEDKTRRFKVVLNEADLKEAALDAENDDYTEGSPQEVILKRHDDRFPKFALRYFDDTDAFTRLRFHVQLGKLLKKSKYPKVMFGEDRERTLTQPIFAFTKLKPMLKKYEAVNQDKLDEKIIDPRYVSEFEKSWIEEKDGKTQLKEVIEQFSPHYNFGEQTIGFRIFDNPNRMHTQDTRLPRLPNLEANEKLKGTEPDAFISTYELRNLFFYQYLYKENRIEKSAEDFLLDYFTNIKRFFKDVKDGTFEPIQSPPDFIKNDRKPFVKGNPKKQKELSSEYNNLQKDMEFRRDMLAEQVKIKYGIGYTSIPHDIREYLLGYKASQYGEYVVNKLTLQVKDVKQRLKDIGKPTIDATKPPPPVKEKTGVEKDRSPRVGEQATWLAEDILHFMPTRKHVANGEEHDQKMNNDQFRILQSSLAYFSSNKTEIWDYFKELGLIHGEKALQHPFLHKVQKADCHISMDFYEKYLMAKYKFLTAIILDITKVKDGKTEYAPQKFIEDNYSAFIPPVQKKGREKSYVNVETLKGKDVPVLLPKGLFNEAISMALNVDKKKGYKNELNTVVYNLEKYSKGDTQDFFGYEHYYLTPKTVENTEGSLILKADYVAALEAKIIELDKQKDALVARKPKNDKDKEKHKEKLQTLRNALRDEHRHKEHILTREQTIRYHQANDRALWLMIKKLQGDKENKDKTTEHHLDLDLDIWQLAQIQDVLNESIEVKGAVPRDSEQKLPLVDVKIVEKLPIRRYGDLRRVLKDRRLATLVTYYHPHQEIAHDKIKKEFEKYDTQHRVEFFEEVYRFEEAVYKAFKDEFPPTTNGVYDYETFMKPRVAEVKGDRIRNYYPHEVFMQIATDHLADRDLAAKYNEKVIQFRNKYSHNQIPYFDWLTDEVQNEATPLMCDKIFVVAKRYYKDLRRLVIR
jgi:hypothetical protein